MRTALIAGLTLLAAHATALPVDRSLELQVGDLHFEKIRFALATEVVPPELATAELLPAGELLVTPLKEGDGLVLLYKRGEVTAIALRVGRPKPVPALDLTEAKKLCPKVELLENDHEAYVDATVDGEPCRGALKRALDGGGLFADHLRLTFTVPGLQAQLRAFQSRLDEAQVRGVTLGYLGATLTLKGETDAATHMKALNLLWHEALGHLDLDDQIEHPYVPLP